MLRPVHIFCFFLCTALALTACGGNGGDGDGDGDTDPGIDAPTDAPAVIPPGCDAPRPGEPECNDCIDNDMDGTIDGNDIECSGLKDDREDSFATGIPGDNMDGTWQDCFFDGNSGAGSGDCRVNTCCYTGTDPNCASDPQNGCDATACAAYCAPLTPPNCDCFGCCTMCDAQGCVDIITHPAVAPNCDADFIHDPAKCPPCTKNTTCTTQCTGTSECGGDTECPSGQFCSDGCCITAIP